MSRVKFAVVLLFVLPLLLNACSSSNSDAPPTGQVHPTNWLAQHPSDPAAQGSASACQACHGADFTGSGNAVSCFNCHASGPPFSIHPASWVNGPLEDHKCFFNDDNPAARLNWTTCATATCHGSNLRGGTTSTAGPSCFSTDFTNPLGATNSCHSSGPPAPADHTASFTSGSNHGPLAKDIGNINRSMGNYCINCHGRPTNQFDGGFIADAAILNNANGNCSGCHTAATAHPTNWVRDNNATYFHSTISSDTRSASCALCHNTLGPGPGDFSGAPSCFSTSFQNANSLTNTCHATGPGGAGHVLPFTDPDLHGTQAKADLTYCQGCHATADAKNPQFNVPIGTLAAGCESSGCHSVGTAHPTGSDVWTFNQDSNQPRRTHFAAGNIIAACSLCHNVTASDSGGNATACTACHLAPTTTFNSKLDCTVCHGTPPTGAADDTGSTTPVNHGVVATVTEHEVCAMCHGARDDGTGDLTTRNGNYLLFNAADAALDQGGSHLDGKIQMNGPTTVGTGYNASNFGCELACHGNNSTTFRLPNASGLTIGYGDFGSGSAACDTCHGYPPDGNADIAPLPVSHLFSDNGASLLANHDTCTVCHGNKDGGGGTHSPTGAYTVADHADGNINMNLDTDYDPATRGCNINCHSSTHVFPNNSNFPVVRASYGSGGGSGACSTCHDSGSTSIPQVNTSSSHAGTYTCEECHTAHGSGDVIIPNNAAAGIAYPNDATHQGGISLGGSATGGFTTEAEICWHCHDSNGVSEWGTNSDTNGTGSNYNFGGLYTAATGGSVTSNWIGAYWRSTNFSYKTAQIQSTHAANSGTGTRSGVDDVGSIRCSYCHDVHNVGAQGWRNGYDNGGVGPLLMGTWKGNPYREDGAPQTGTAYTGQGRYGAVPRGGTGATELGGFQIDQNNGNPTSTWTANDSAGLCEYCHGNGDGSWNTGAGPNEIDTLDYYGTNDWVTGNGLAINGHSNAVLGGSGIYAANIFSTAIRNGADTSFNGGNPKMGNTQYSGSTRAYSFRGNEGGDRMNPRISSNYAYSSYNWGADTSTALDTQYHQFSCSKCHNPHASRLPRLMITNCLDTKHNTWVDNYNLISTTGVANATNAGVPLSNATSAQNCHRLSNPSYPQANGDGWNNVTPW